LVDVIKPSTDLLPVLLEKNLIGRYDTPLRAIFPAHAKSVYFTNNGGLRAQNGPIDWIAEDLIPALIYPLTMARHAPHPYSAALFYDFLISEEGQRLIAKEGRVVAHPKVEPIYPRMKELQSFLGTSRIQLNTLEQNQKHYKEGIQILDEIVLKRKGS
jgi:iron(III) transport system substrate-binding protein